MSRVDESGIALGHKLPQRPQNANTVLVCLQNVQFRPIPSAIVPRIRAQEASVVLLLLPCILG